MSRRNPRGATAKKRRQQARSRRIARREYIPTNFWKALVALDVGLSAARLSAALSRVIARVGLPLPPMVELEERPYVPPKEIP